jgi:hypothetical protein
MRRTRKDLERTPPEHGRARRTETETDTDIDPDTDTRNITPEWQDEKTRKLALVGALTAASSLDWSRHCHGCNR